MKRIFLGLCLAVFLPTTAFTQVDLTLADAIKIGLENNFSVKIEKKRVEIAKNNNNIGQAGMLPLVNANLVQNLSFTGIENPASFLQSADIKSRTLNPAMAVSWTVFNGFNVQMTKDRLEYLEKQSLGNAQLVVENSIQSIILAYYTAQLEQQRLSVFERTLQLSADRYKYIQMKAELGTAVTFDMLQDKNAYLTDSSNYLQQVLNYRNAARNLNLLLGTEVETQFKLVDDLTVDPRDFVFDELYARMSSSNSNLRNQYINQEILRRDVGVAKSALFPRVDLNINGSQNKQVQMLDNAVFAGGVGFPTGDAVKSSTLNYTAGLTLSYTLFNGGRIRRQLENAQINEQIGQLQINELKMTLKNNLIGLYDGYNLRKTLLNIAKENVATAELNLRLATDRYQNGTISSFNYRDIQLVFLTSSLGYLQSVYNLIDAEVELLRLTGGITNRLDEN